MAGTVALPGITPVTALGDGYDSFAFTARSTALAPVTKRSGGTKTWFSYYKCKTVKKLLESINVSASISGSYGFVDEVSEKASYFHSLLTTSNFVSVVVYVAKTELLVPEKVELAVTPDERDFFKWYGDSYASSIQLGGELIATYIFYCQTEEEVEAVSDQLKVCGIDEDGALDASFEANMSRAQSEIDVTQSMRTYLAGYVDMDKPPPTTAGLFDYATKVFSTEPNDPVTVNYTVEGYEHVPGFNAPWFDAVVANRRLLNDGVGRERSLKESRMLLSQRKNDIESVKTVYRRYGITPVDAEEIAAHEREIDDDVSTLEDTLAYIDADPTREVGPPDLPSLQWKPARLELEQVDVGPWGGNGGDPFDDVDIGLARHAMRPRRLWLRGGAAVDMIICSYVKVGAAGETDSPTQHGGGGGELSNELYIPEGARALRISGQAGSFKNWQVLLYLQLEYEGQPVFSWPPGHNSGQDFHYELHSNEALIGFNGRSGKLLDRLVPVVARFLPIRWEKV